VSAGENGTITPGSGLVPWGSSPTYGITPDLGYRVSEVLVDGSPVAAGTSYQFAPVEASHTLSASFTAEGLPTTTVSGATGGWSKRPVRLTFTGHPGSGGVPIAFTEYKVGSGDWTPGSAVTIRTQGVTVVQFRSQDQDGVLQDPPNSCTVRIDTKRPRVVARPLTGRQGTIAPLRYMVRDPRPSSGTALVRAVVTGLGGGRTFTRASTLPVTVNAWHALQVKTGRLSPGAYLVTLRAMDKAGNFQRGVTHVRLTIR
jgi:hypothetical protein